MQLTHILVADSRQHPHRAFQGKGEVATKGMSLEAASLYNGFCLDVSPWEVETIFPMAILGVQVNPPLWPQFFKIDYVEA